ncbi:MAG: hypothetical protein EOO09_14875 [Chitinophagaceae bacterium]|nr:MAG: hypothetical protein EOO09_14875 [Chitinophagaceae bacterium]
MRKPGQIPFLGKSVQRMNTLSKSLLGGLLCCMVFPGPGFSQTGIKVDVHLHYQPQDSTGSCILLWKDSAGRIVKYRNVQSGKQINFLLPRDRGDLQLHVLSEVFDAVMSDSIISASSDKDVQDLNVTLYRKVRQLREIVVNSKASGVVLNGDTVEFNVSRYVETGMRKIKEVLARMEGFRVEDDGRIFFHGTELSAVLLEGEDLTGRDYKSLSENLSSGIITKVQVLRNYNSDRLLKEIQNSSEVAINLRIASDTKGKTSGNLLAGAGTNNRYIGDIAVTSIRKKLRTLLFGTLNNLGEVPSQARNDPDKPEAAINGTGYSVDNRFLVVPSQIQLPLDLPHYTNQNNDGQVKLVNGWSVKPSVKMRSDIAFAQTRSLNASVSEITAIVPREIEWYTKNVQSSDARQKRADLNLAIAIDRKMNQVIEIQAGIRILRSTSKYRMDTQGVVDDALSESVRQPAIHLHSNWRLTKKFNTSTYLLLKGAMGFVDGGVNTDLTSKRFNQLFGTGSDDALSITQQLTGKTFSLDNAVQFYFNKGKFQHSSTLFMAINLRDFSQTLSAANGQQPSGVYLLDTSLANGLNVRAGLRQGLLYRWTSRDEVSLTGSVGIATLISRATQSNLLIHNLAVNYLHKISMFKSITLGSDFGTRAAEPDLHYAGPLISGNASVNYGSRSGVMQSSTGTISLSYMGVNVFRGNQVHISCSYLKNQGPEIPDHVIWPAYSVQYTGRRNQSKLISVNTNIEHLIKATGSKLSVNVNGSAMTHQFLVNGEPNRNNLYFSRFKVALAQSFRKINVEVRAGNDQFVNHRPVGKNNTASAASIGFYARWKPVSQFRVKAGYTKYRLAASSVVDVAEFSSTLLLKKRIAFSLDIHNLFNETTILFRTVGALMSSSSDFRLIPRYMLCKLSVDF